MNLETLLIPIKFDTDGFKASSGEIKSEADTSLASIGKGMTNVGMSMTAAITAPIVGGLTAAVWSTQEWANKVDGLGDVLGTTADDSATLVYAIENIGGNAEALTGQMAYLTKGLVDSNGGLGKTGETLASLGIAFQDANGNMLPTTDILTAVATKVSELPDGLEKTRLMTELFGKSGKDLSDTMNALANDGFENAKIKAGELGLLMGDEGVNSSIEFGKATQDLKASFEGLGIQVTTALLPVITPLIEKITELVSWFTNLDPGVQRIILGVLGFAAILPPLITVIGTVITTISTLGTIFTAVSGVIGVVSAPVLIVIAAIAAAVALLYIGWKNNWFGIRDTLDAVIKFMKSLVDAFLKVLKGDWSGAGETLKAGWSAIWDLVTARFNSAVSSITGALSGFTSWVKNTWSSFVDVIKNFWSDAWDSIKAYADNAWNSLKGSISNLVNNIKKFFTNINWKQVGKDIVEGIGNGISSMINWIKNKALEIAQSVSETITGFFENSSPSKRMYREGINVAKGLFNGLDAEYEKQISKFNSSLTLDTKVFAPAQQTQDNTALLSALGSMQGTQIDYRRMGREFRDAVLMATG